MFYDTENLNPYPLFSNTVYQLRKMFVLTRTNKNILSRFTIKLSSNAVI